MLLKNIFVIVLSFLLVSHLCIKYFMLEGSKPSTSKNPLSATGLRVKGVANLVNIGTVTYQR
jgi:hypothetical protein